MTDTTTATTAGRSEGLSREILVLAGVVILGTIMTVLDLTVVNVQTRNDSFGHHREIVEPIRRARSMNWRIL